jgi:3-phosphoshikimate 1-carboxyvinyltransferase
LSALSANRKIDYNIPMLEQIEMQPTGPIHGSIRPPGSKSLTNRAMICAALAQGESVLIGALDSDDTRVMIEALRQLGLYVEHRPDEKIIRVAGCAGRLPARASHQAAELFLGNSGTSIRFLTALVALGQGHFRLDGTARMRQRPIEDLLVALRELGADARSESHNGCPPVIVQANSLHGGKACVAGDISSQFLSALLMAAPVASEPVELSIRGTLVSQPYVAMTLAVMESFGITRPPLAWPMKIMPAQYRGCRYEVEPDASAASYFFAAAAITQGRITVEGLHADSLQGDVAFCDCLRQMGCEVAASPQGITVAGRTLHGIDIDMNAISDTVQTLGAVALFADGPTTIRNVGHIRHKETDRLSALAIELRKLGAQVDEYDDGLRIERRGLQGAVIDTYDDHRMAMSLALVGLRQPGVVIRDPGCTAKTYPAFFQDLERLVAFEQ